MEIFISIVTIVGAILQIILFFKIWGMTNDVSKILDIMRERKTSNFVASAPMQSVLPKTVSSSATELKADNEDDKFRVGEKVFYFGKELIITGDNGNGTYVCSDLKGKIYSTSMECEKIKRNSK